MKEKLLPVNNIGFIVLIRCHSGGKCFSPSQICMISLIPDLEAITNLSLSDPIGYIRPDCEHWLPFLCYISCKKCRNLEWSTQTKLSSTIHTWMNDIKTSNYGFKLIFLLNIFWLKRYAIINDGHFLSSSLAFLMGKIS